MATIKQRIDTVTEDVSVGKDSIAHAITVKGVDTVSGDTFSIMAANILKLMVIQLDMPSVNYINKTVTLSSKMSGTTIYYRFNPDTSWIVYTNPLTNITGGTIETYCKKEGYVSSEIMTQTLEGIGQLVVVGDDCIATTDDMSTFEINTDYILGTPHITYGNGMYVVIGREGHVVISTDGHEWTQTYNLEDKYWNDIAYFNGYFIAVNSVGDVATSQDGTDWTLVTWGSSNDILTRIIVTDNNVCVFGEGKVFISGDGETFDIYNTFPLKNLSATDIHIYGTYGGDRIVAVLGGETNGYCTVSEDYGHNWNRTTNINYGLTENFNNITYGNGIFMVVGAFGHVLVSSNGGESWIVKTNTIESTGGENNCALTFKNGIFIHAVNNTIMVSHDNGEGWDFVASLADAAVFSDAIAI